MWPTGRRSGAAGAVVAVLLALVAGCARGGPSPVPEPPQADLTTPGTLVDSPPPAGPADISLLDAPAPAGPADISPVSAADLGASWRPGCPVEPAELRRVSLDYLGFDLQTHRGELIVHRDVVDEVVAIFTDLRDLGYPVERMQNVAVYPGADDETSMRDNNTSAFSCRGIPGSGSWALHAYGRAIDVNPLLNPYRDAAGEIQPATAEVYLDRNRIDPGLLHDGDPAVRAFTDRGWTWGGHWTSPVDYQHFELPHG